MGRRMRLPNGFGQITQIKNKRLRKPFRAMITVAKTPEGKPICKLLKPEAYFATYNEAYAALVKYNSSSTTLLEEITMEELYTRWSKYHYPKVSKQSVYSFTKAWDYCGVIYGMYVREVRVRHLRNCIEQCPKESMKNIIKTTLNVMLDYAVEYEYADKNYARDFTIDKYQSKTSHSTFTEHEMDILWDNQAIPFVNAVLVQCYMGWRPQEMVNIKLSDVDLDGMTITGGLKTEAGKNRIVPIHPKILPCIKRLLTIADKLHSEYLVNGTEGNLNYAKYARTMLKYFQELNISHEHRAHDPRKHFITMCKKYNVDEYAIKKIVGHTITDITEKIYTERDAEWLREEILKIS